MVDFITLVANYSSQTNFPPLTKYHCHPAFWVSIDFDLELVVVEPVVVEPVVVEPVVAGQEVVKIKAAGHHPCLNLQRDQAVAIAEGFEVVELVAADFESDLGHPC